MIGQKDGPYTCVCGYCRLPMQLHPYEHCLYEYKPVILNSRTYGYRMTQKSDGANAKKIEKKPS